MSGRIIETQWSPDTCGCTVSYLWIEDAATGAPLSGAPITYGHTSSVDLMHSGLVGSGLIQTLWNENVLKNQLQVALAQTTILSGLNPAQYLVSGVQLNSFSGLVLWSFQGVGANRQFFVNVDNLGVKASQITQLQSIANTTFGSGKVVIQ